MKRKSTQEATVAEAPPKNLRSKLPRRKRVQISPIIFNFTSSKPTFSLNSEVSCNTTLGSVVLPRNTSSFQSVNDASKKKAAVEVSVSVSENSNSCVESCSVFATEAESKLNNKQSLNDVALSAAQNSPSTVTVDQIAAKTSGDFDLACSEEFTYEDCEVSSAELFPSDIFEDFTDEYTPSLWLDSGSQFSERSNDDDSEPSPCFSLFKDLSKQFSKIRSPNFKCDTDVDEYSDENAFWRFEDKEDEESYCCLRRRERNQASKVINYAEAYGFETEYGGLIIEQRLLMVNWIIEISRKKELHKETMFLGVCLLDRFLSKGFFTSRRNLQLLGIACLTLAIRIEENQPYNSVRQKAFYVGSNVYCRTEVVAMEWVVQEVLKFQCLSPTIYNFLWFYLKAATANEGMREKANYLATIALLDHRKLQFWPSTVAACIVILVSLSANQDESSQQVMKAHFRTKVDDLPECIKSMEWLVKYAR